MGGPLAAVVLALAVGACGDSAAVVVPPTTPTRPAPAGGTAAGPAIPSNYAGLGAPSRTFAQAHQESPRGRGAGVPLVSGVQLDAAGRVTGWVVAFNDRPPLSDYERIVDAAAVADLPRDRITVSTAHNCLVFGSPSLKRLIGVSYASVTTVAASTTAAVQSRARPTC